MHRSILLVACVVCLVAPAPVLFGEGKVEESKPSSQVAPGPFGKYVPPINVTAVKPVDDTHRYFEGEDLENNAWTRAYRDELGIVLKYNWTADSTLWEQKMNLAIASGDLPDIMPVNGNMLAMLVEAQLIQPLGDAYEEYASKELRDLQWQQGSLPFDEATYGGKLMGLPETISFVDASNMLWVREDWRKKFSLPKPDTMDKLLNLIYAYAQKDPDGNGKTDTYGLAVCNTLYNQGYGSIEGFCNGFHAYPSAWIKSPSGGLIYGSIQPEMKQALTALQRMYREKVIDPEFGVKDRAKVIEDTIAGMFGVATGAQWVPMWPYDQARNNLPGFELAAYEIPSVDNSPTLSQVPSRTGWHWVVNVKCAHPEAAVKLMNLWVKIEYTERPSRDWMVGDVSKNILAYKWPICITWPAFKNVENFEAYLSVAAGGSKEGLLSEQAFVVDSLTAYTKGDDAQWGIWYIFGPNGSQSIIADRIKRSVFMYNKFYGAPTSTMVTKGSTLDKMEQEAFIKYIMGDEKAFDVFVQDWNKLGGDQITQEVNAWAKR